MKNQYKGRYGLSEKEVMIMKSKFRRVKEDDGTDWKNLDEFCKWAMSVGYKPGMRMKKESKSLPHSIENTYFVNTGEPEMERHPTYIAADSPFCRAFTVKDCPSISIGCFRWREYFVNNWNKNICRKGKPVVRSADVTFRYEHPDLVREGIVWAES